MDNAEVNEIVEAIRDAFLSNSHTAADTFTPANIADALFHIGDAINNLASKFNYLDLHVRYLADAIANAGTGNPPEPPKAV